MLKELKIRSSKRNEMIDITSRVEELIDIEEGTAMIYSPHTTSAVTINESADPDVKKDMLEHLSELVPEDKGFSHAEGNSDSHIKASIIGPSENVIIRDSKLMLGTWQGIFFCEFDGPRERKLFITYS
ncbi:MAG: secondary thiamine-phosphate synthase enzyme YjbQ [Nanobdellota archaeon]